ncbi:chemotaxis protein CheA [Bacillus paralicheniformis]|jgi:two-component system chemotaxis sensor kinase CheA|uniref:chemotaxis protein CheA n=1 Tax=Bacillus paralicheniformis TaxID=1648923 RepID=UPI0003423BC5|nr:chemotaxis protein CheA [Bacillus paralicheniformis]KUL07517.1 chemotaxis protein CheA [Bacillus licheniformis LMG 7559]AGN36266.1 two-component sensor histidine kinase CheA [Bacillus paralicheniformis ATCC 9945a]AYQ16296.1 chemotaxis protein CheA [Bacillus paralicheniformis]KRT87931.1 chemotaxis protein CheA [Bacillus paralicheniformis]MBU8699982.1 chemotaxis protein CheA [Bacillus paralicheniformis]
MDMNQYLDVFIEESREHLQTCNEKLLELEKNPTDLQLVHDIFRAAHTLKGMSATMGYEDMAHLTHSLENVLDAIRNEEMTITSEWMDIMFEALDDLEAIVLSIIEGGDGKRDVSEVCAKLDVTGANKEAAASAEAPETASSETKWAYDEFQRTVIAEAEEQGFKCYEINVALKEDCLLKGVRVYMVFEQLNEIGEVVKTIPETEVLESEDFDSEFVVCFLSKHGEEEIFNKINGVSEIEKIEVTELKNDFSAQEEAAPAAPEKETAPKDAEKTPAKQPDGKKEAAKPAAGGGTKTIRVNIDRLDSLMNLFEELVIDRGRLEQIAKELEHGELTDTVERMTRISGDLQSIILNMRMVPVETVFNRFPRMVRQLTKELNKKIELSIFGAETELDRTVIDEIGDPLVHLLRNSLDHGIEAPEVRVKNGKPETGQVRLKAYHSGNHVFIEVEDDGAGINRKKVLEKALERNVITERDAETIEDHEIDALIFAPGFSTADQISDISGRGVGLDVVKSKLESLGGSVSIRSSEGEGSLFSIQLPLTLSIISVLLVKLENETFAIPISSIIETAVIDKKDILQTHDREVIDFRGHIVPVVYLKEQFNVEDSSDDLDQLHAIVVKKGDKLTAFVVDSFIGQQEVVLKSLGDYLTNVFAISGATILGDGQVALIIDCNALIK